MRGRMLAQIFWSELEKIANASTDGSESVEENKNLNKVEEKEVDREEDEIDDDKDSILGTSFMKKEKDKYYAKGLPILKDRSDEGLRFDPEMQAYVPDFNIRAQQISQSAKQEGIMEGTAQGMRQAVDKIKSQMQEKKVLQAKSQQVNDLKEQVNEAKAKQRVAQILRQKLEQVRAGQQ